MTHHEHDDRPTADDDPSEEHEQRPSPPDEALPQDPETPAQVEPRHD